MKKRIVDILRRIYLCVVILMMVAGNAAAQKERPVKKHHLVTYVERGDPDAPPSTITVDLDKLKQLLETPPFRTKGPYKERRTIALKMLEVAGRYVNMSTRDNPGQILEMLHVFDRNYNLSTAFCAVGVCYSACQAYCEVPPEIPYDRNVIKTFRGVIKDVKQYYFTTSPSVPLLVAAARTRKMWVGRSGVSHRRVKPGWLVVMNFGGNVSDTSHPQHIGLVERATAEGIATIEFNTSDKPKHLKKVRSGGDCGLIRKLSATSGCIKRYSELCNRSLVQ